MYACMHVCILQWFPRVFYGCMHVCILQWFHSLQWFLRVTDGFLMLHREILQILTIFQEIKAVTACLNTQFKGFNMENQQLGDTPMPFFSGNTCKKEYVKRRDH